MIADRLACRASCAFAATAAADPSPGPPEPVRTVVLEVRELRCAIRQGARRCLLDLPVLRSLTCTALSPRRRRAFRALEATGTCSLLGLCPPDALDRRLPAERFLLAQSLADAGYAARKCVRECFGTFERTRGVTRRNESTAYLARS